MYDKGNKLTAWFFEHLYSDDEFCAALGRVALATGELESALKDHLERSAQAKADEKATLGQLISVLEKHELLNPNHEIHLRTLADQRNYLIHNLFPLFAGKIEETLLARNVVPEDLLLFIERANVLAEDLKFFAHNFREHRVNT